jgi:8-oxo-dGTP pyrophosphatase MutT (NUDIX family)
VYGLGGQVGRGTFENAEDLEAWMIHVGLDTSRWGVTPGTKTVRDLLHELQARECSLQKLEGRVYRCVSVVNLVLRNPMDNHAHLHCYQQRSVDGTCKPRNALPSARMVEGEEPLAVARRAVMEQLGEYVPDPDAVVIDEKTLLAWYEIDESISFPSLHTQYRLHQVEVVVWGLPHEPFTTTPPRTGSAPQQENCWQWLTDSPADGRRTRAEAKGAPSATSAAAVSDAAANAPDGGGAAKPRRRGSICL